MQPPIRRAFVRAYSEGPRNGLYLESDGIVAMELRKKRTKSEFLICLPQAPLDVIVALS